MNPASKEQAGTLLSETMNMDVRAVTQAWLISRQQGAALKQDLRRNAEEIPVAPSVVDDDADDDIVITIDKRNDFVPLRRGRRIEASESEGFWSNALFWKGMVFGLLAVVLVKIAFDVHAPFGISWYVY